MTLVYHKDVQWRREAYFHGDRESVKGQGDREGPDTGRFVETLCSHLSF